MTDYKPLDLGPIRERSEVYVDDDGLYDALDWSTPLTKDLSNLMETCSDIPPLLAEVVRLRREMAVDHFMRFPETPPCPVCVAARSEGWDPSKPLDWKPEAP